MLYAIAFEVLLLTLFPLFFTIPGTLPYYSQRSSLLFPTTPGTLPDTLP